MVYRYTVSKVSNSLPSPAAILVSLPHTEISVECVVVSSHTSNRVPDMAVREI